MSPYCRRSTQCDKFFRCMRIFISWTQFISGYTSINVFFEICSRNKDGLIVKPNTAGISDSGSAGIVADPSINISDKPPRRRGIFSKPREVLNRKHLGYVKRSVKHSP